MLFRSAPHSIFSEHLEHLCTEFEMGLLEPVDFLAFIQALHPTPALGTHPRNAGSTWLRRHLHPSQRKRFGAPFAALWPNGEVFCVVAIRGVQWQSVSCRLWLAAVLSKEVTVMLNGKSFA